MARRPKKEENLTEAAIQQVREAIELVGENLDALEKVLDDDDGKTEDPPEDSPASKGRRKRGSSKKTRTRKGKGKGEDDGLSIDDVRTVGLKVVEEFGNDEMNSILDKFGDGCKRSSDLDPEFYQAVIDECEKALAE